MARLVKTAVIAYVQSVITCNVWFMRIAMQADFKLINGSNERFSQSDFSELDSEHGIGSFSVGRTKSMEAVGVQSSTLFILRWR